MTDPNSPVFYDSDTDSMYVKVRPEPGVDCRVDDERDLVIDLGEDGAPVGYDIQYASRHPDVISEALIALQAWQIARSIIERAEQAHSMDRNPQPVTASEVTTDLTGVSEDMRAHVTRFLQAIQAA